jgi:hypothetical protein
VLGKTLIAGYNRFILDSLQGGMDYELFSNTQCIVNSIEVCSFCF